MSFLLGPGLFILLLRSSGDKLGGIKWSYLFLRAQTGLLQARGTCLQRYTLQSPGALLLDQGRQRNSKSPGLSPPMGVHRGGGGAPGKEGVAGLRGYEMQPVELLWEHPLCAGQGVSRAESLPQSPESRVWTWAWVWPRLLGASLFSLSQC